MAFTDACRARLTTALRIASMTFHPENMNTFTHMHELEDKVKQSKRALVLFCASWCPFCQNFFSTFDRLPSKHGFDNTLRVYIDDYDNPLWEDYSIEAVPTVVLFDKGRVARRLDARLGSGLTEKKFNEWLKSA
jgi:thiol-disulfide isomerase/thioredoxin